MHCPVLVKDQDTFYMLRPKRFAPLTILIPPFNSRSQIHQRPDDLGRGVGPARRESLITGNAGARLGCGVIFLTPTMSRDLN